MLAYQTQKLIKMAEDEMIVISVPGTKCTKPGMSTDKRDARVSRLSLSDKGALQVAAFNGALVETAKNVLAPLNADDVVQFSALLEKILCITE